MNIVTGHRGFIGSHIYARVQNPLGVEIDDAEQFLEDFDRWDQVQSVYHFGAISSTTETDVRRLYQKNVQFSINLFERCIQHGITVRYASSASVYGNTARDLNPLTQYALSKAIVDYYVLDNLPRFHKVQGFRLFNVYGTNELHKGTQASPVTQFTQQALTSGEVRVFENSRLYQRDFICVEDVCDRVIDCDYASGIYDLGTSDPISFLEVAEIVANKHGAEIKEIPFPSHLSGKYQYYTMSRRDFVGPYKSVEQWLSENTVI